MSVKAVASDKMLEIFEILFGDNINIKPVTNHVSADQSLMAARYVIDDDSVCGWILADPMFAAAAGGALTLIPPDVVKEAHQKQTLEGMLLENFGEIMNICSSVIQSKVERHVRLDRAEKPGDFSDIADVDQSSRSSFEVQFPRYGKGIVTVAIA
ncbi:MAG TPA: hypothetical protein PKD64_05405 [Pirellulaceae bacterium]|nr:hypothetical protein [Pirellulaceae bacterium]HMO91614.1 hypothetical protein [Pirellulaceae bacterium]HMP68311.1 hypothetical protein [Pirellulaceae bacterium]